MMKTAIRNWLGVPEVIADAIDLHEQHFGETYTKLEERLERKIEESCDELVSSQDFDRAVEEIAEKAVNDALEDRDTQDNITGGVVESEDFERRVKEVMEPEMDDLRSDVEATQKAVVDLAKVVAHYLEVITQKSALDGFSEMRVELLAAIDAVESGK